MNEKGITGTSALAEIIANWPASEHDKALRILEARTSYFRAMLKTGTMTEFMKAFYESLDDTIAQSIARDKGTAISCKKGCHFCCRQSVVISAGEAELIAEYCKERGINIPKDYLEEQLKYDWKEIAVKDVGWCVFLKGGECSIYPVRPLACRKYFVASPPEQCDTVKFPSSKGHRVAVAVYTWPEIEASAFAALMSERGKSRRLPEMLMKYAK